jgi:RNA polymerase sigma-70 factor, ECF subfamily
MDEVAGRSIGVGRDVDSELQERIVGSSSLVFRVAYAVLRHREDAEDVAQEAFLRAHGHFHALRDRTRFRAWLVRVAWRLALDRQRSDRRRLRRDAAACNSSLIATTEAVALVNERNGRLLAAVARLPNKLRLTLVLAAIEGYETREVAALLSVPEGTVKSRLFLARKKLKEMMS